MRQWAWAAAVLAMLCGCGAPRPPAKVFLKPEGGPGCLGVLAEACVRWLQTTTALDERFIPSSMARRHQVDVNGKPLSSGLIALSGHLPDRLESMLIVIRLNTNDTVASVEWSLLDNLVTAQTEQGYDTTAVYDVVARILGQRCPSLARLGLYRFVENSVLPKLTMTQQDLAGGLSGLHRRVWHAADVPYCGARFSYTAFYEWRGTKVLESGRDISGYWSIEVKS